MTLKNSVQFLKILAINVVFGFCLSSFAFRDKVRLINQFSPCGGKYFVDRPVEYSKVSSSLEEFLPNRLGKSLKDDICQRVDSFIENWKSKGIVSLEIVWGPEEKYGWTGIVKKEYRGPDLPAVIYLRVHVGNDIIARDSIAIPAGTPYQSLYNPLGVAACGVILMGGLGVLFYRLMR